MNSSDIPSRYSKAFSINGNKNNIPTESSTSTLGNGEATFDSGFPPLTMTAISAGGIPPDGKDMNGILYSITLKQQWQDVGMGYSFNQTFATSISGYPKGAILPSSDLTGRWLNLNNGNLTSPESASGNDTGWVPAGSYGITSITLSGSSSVTMSSIQAAKERIVLTGALTANINLIFPAWIKGWVVYNNCTGPYSVTCKTASGSGVIVIPGLVSRIFCDGTNITDETMSTQTDLVGSVMAFAVNSAPTGWLAANGQAVSRNIYARLFSRIGTTWGAGDGSTTFNLPDARGEFIRGWDNGRGVDPGRTFSSAQKGTIVGAKDDNDDSANVSFLANGSTVDYGSDQVLFSNYPGIKPYYLNTTDKSVVPTSAQSSFFSVTRPRNIALLYCIKF